MNESTKTKKALHGSLLALVLCIVLLIGTTFAWFTDTASTGVNKIQSGTLKVGLEYKVGDQWQDATGQTLTFKTADNRAADKILWEPGCTYELPALRVVNKGNLALKYKIKINGIKGDEKLNEVIDWTISDTALDADHKLAAKATSDELVIKGHMQESAGNEYQDKSIDGISITVYATQDTVENDSFNNRYDENAGYPIAKYSDMKDAFASGGAIAINDNITADETKTIAADRITVKKPTTLYLGATYTVPGSLEDSSNWAALYVAKDLTINASSNGGINCLDKTDASASYIGGPYVAHIAGEGITVTVNGGNYYGGGTIFNVQQGTLIVNDGFFQVAPDVGTHDYRYILNCIDENYKAGTANIIVKGGTYVNFDPSNNAAEGEHTNFVAEGYKVVSEAHGSDTWYTVVPK